MKYDLFTFHAWMGERWSWWSIVPITLFWVFLWPLGLLWFVVSSVGRYTARDTSPQAIAARRAAWTTSVKETNGTTPSRLYSTDLGLICWSLCWLPLVGQGLVPLILKLVDTDVKALFIAFYLPESFQWLFIASMVILGAALLGIAIKNTHIRK